MKSLQGQLLVATPQLPDENFHHAVVLMVEHNQNGALGVILNRFAEESVQQLWEQVSETPCASQRRINLGGPVSGPLLALHTESELSEMEVISGVYLAARKDLLDRLVGEEGVYRIFLGHAGWGGGQLERELKEGSWLLTQATQQDVFHDDEDLWGTVAKKIGDAILRESLHLKHLPQDPSMN